MMHALHIVFSPSGRLRPLPFIYGAVAVYVLGIASHFLTTPDVMLRAGLWPFIAAQAVLIWIWFVLHAKRLRDAGRGSGLAAGIGALYVLSLVLLLILAASFFNTSANPMMNPNATGALELLLFLYIVVSLAGSTHYDLAWLMVTALTVLAFAPIAAALGLTAWSATRPSANQI